MPRPFSINTLIWIDGTAALLSACLVFILRGWLSELFNLPQSLLITLSFISAGYAAFSLSLALRKTKPVQLLQLLIYGNCLWAIACITLLLYFINMASIWGLIYFALEALFVAALALLERKQVN
jgi:hypothetical protein